VYIGRSCKIQQVAGFFAGRGKETGQWRDKSIFPCIMKVH
jgi:hypothetical protein